MATSTSASSTTTISPTVINSHLFSLDEAIANKLRPAPPVLKNPKPDPNMLIVLGSTSPLKLRAVQRAFAPLAAVCRGCDVKSGVSDQPCGQKETLTGARNRATRSRETTPEAKLWVGIENGMLPIGEMSEECANVKSGWVDVACIVIVSPSSEYLLWSDALAIPKEALPSCLDKHGRAFDVWSPLKDPHRQLTSGLRPRDQFLEETLSTWVVHFGSSFGH